MSEKNNKIDSDENRYDNKENRSAKEKAPLAQEKSSRSKFWLGLLIIVACIAFVYRNNVYIVDYLDLEYLIRSYKNENEPAILGDDKLSKESPDNSAEGISKEENKEAIKEPTKEEVIKEEPAPTKMSYVNSDIDLSKIDNKMEGQAADLKKLVLEEPQHAHYQDNILPQEPPLHVIQDIDLIEGSSDGVDIVTGVSEDFSSDEVIQGEIDNQQGEMHDSILSNSSSATSDNRILENAARYRTYLKNASTLVDKFRIGKNYAQELDILKAPLLSNKRFSEKGFADTYKGVEDFIEQLEMYNKLLMDSNSSQYEEVNVGGQLLSNFIKIKKENVDYKAVFEMKSKIEQKMQLFNEFLYSQQLQDAFLLDSQ